jgi:DNA invertase Pin-like site-specific DNA recombinase
MDRLLALVGAEKVQVVFVAKLDRLTRSVKDLCELLARFEQRGVALISGAESLGTSSAAGRLMAEHHDGSQSSTITDNGSTVRGCF